MSGLDKSISTYLQYGAVEKLPKTKACKLLSGYNDFTHGGTHTRTCEGRTCTFETNIEKKETGTCDFSWSIEGVKQVDGYTMSSKYDSGKGNIKGWIDFGSNFWGRPQLSMHAGYNVHVDGSHNEHFSGLTWSSENFGWKCQVNESKGKSFKERFWWKNGPFYLNTHTAMNLDNFQMQAYNCNMGYEPSDKFGIYACHFSNGAKDLGIGKFCTSIFYDLGKL